VFAARKTVAAQLSGGKAVSETNDQQAPDTPPPLRQDSAGKDTPSFAQWEDAVVQEMSRLVLLVKMDAERIPKKAAHLVESRRYPQDCLRNAEILEDYATQLQTHARQIVRRALENQP
jgi:hypothetical protein